uniref:Protein MIS12 homolog n=1 Tax=Parascaris univalens TaxID=6257 RepID=A0A915AVY2_PARUN
MNAEGRASGRVSAARLINEYEAQHFGFSPKGFTDCVYNIILEKWSDVVSNVLYPRLLEVGLGDLSIEQKCELKRSLAGIICKKDMIGALMKKMEDYTLLYKFRVPDNVTLPSDQCNLLVNEKIDEEGEIGKRISALKEEIINIRMAKKVVDDEITLTEGILKVLKEIREENQEPIDC